MYYRGRHSKDSSWSVCEKERSIGSALYIEWITVQ